MTEINYTTIDSPYNDNMERQSDNDNTLFTNVQPSTGMGSINNISSPNQISGNVISGSTLDNLWLKSWLKSQNYLPGANGFLIDGISGDVEFGNGKFRGDITGASGTFSGTISGGSISIGTTPNWFKVDALGNIWSGQNTLALAQTNTFAVTNAGSLYAMNGTIAGTLTIGGRLATIVGGAINADGDFINELINTKLDTSAETILGDFTFGESGAIKMITDDDNGLWISPTGILGKTGGVNTISIGVDGSANFAGTLTAAAGTLGSITAGTFTGISIAIGSINNIFKADANGIYLGNATFASAPFNVTMAGALTATSATITGAITISSGSGIANLSDAGGLATMDESAIDTSNITNGAGWTDDSSLNTFVADVYTGEIESLQSQIDGQITTWFYAGVPTLLNLPASDWTTDTLKDEHLGDLYYDNDSGYAYRFLVDTGTYSWLQLSDSDIAAALAAANAAQDTADHKRTVFTAEPTTPYNVGDLWLTSLDASVGDFKKCVTEKLTGAYDAAHWLTATEALSNAATAQSAAEDAQDDADTALGELEDIADDDILSQIEKPSIIQNNTVILTEQAGIDTQATAYGITTEKTAYDGAITTLTNYLATLTTPVLWSNLTDDTTIVGTTFRTNFAAVYTTRQTLLDAIYATAKDLADAAAATADWASINDIPATLAAPSGAGLYLSSTYMGYYDSAAWKTYMDSSGNMILGDIAGGNTGLAWNQGTGALSIKGSIVITNPSDIDQTALTNSADAGATVGATWGTNLNSIPATLGTPSADGLYLSASYLGYYKSTAWTSYIRNNGDFYFAGDAGSSIDWNVTTASTLTVKGKIETGTGSVVDGTYLSAGTVTSAKTTIAIQGWTHDLVFSASSNVQVAWASGTIALSDGATTYSIDAGNTGTMSAINYIYLDTDTSSTVLQTTTTYSTAIGDNKILIAVAENVAADKEATFQVYGGIGGIGTLLTTANLAANCITANLVGANEIIANSANLKNLIVTDGKINDLAVSKLTAGTITSKAITLAVSAGTGDAKIQAGKSDFTNTDNGFILGIDDSDSDKAKFYIGDSSTYLNWDGTNMIVKAGTGSSIDFSYINGATAPDDNATVGAIAGTNFTGAGTDNNEVDDDGIVTRLLYNIFGDGSDGDVTISSNTTLTSDMYYDDLTVNNGYTLNTGGYRVFVKGTLTNNGTISRVGNVGGDGAIGASHSFIGGIGGTAGAALGAGFFAAGVVGVAGNDGANGGITAGGSSSAGGAVGTASTNSLGTDGSAGSTGGAGGDSVETSTGSPTYAGGVAGAGGSGGTATAATTKPKTLVETILMRNFEPSTPIKLNVGANTGGASGGGGGGGFNTDPQSTGGGGGGAGGTGSTGGTAAILARIIINTGTISVLGGAGGDGANGRNGEVRTFSYASGGGGGGGGGTGGSGGILILVYNSLTNTGTISVAGGAGGTGGTGGIAGVGTPNTYPAEDGFNGNTGTTGASGVLIQLEC